ncbi:DUF4113 domain-containing protein [Pseudomonas sp. DNDY-54]|uniref:DUF4113 domain-containing protein n=1 Tax=Pseudomonas sp. DNDY-54 TaxID=2870860 RepID=UPI003917D602
MPEGRGTVRLGRIPAAPKWAMRREMPSQRYTTRWDERQLSARSGQSSMSKKAFHCFAGTSPDSAEIESGETNPCVRGRQMMVHESPRIS